MVLSIIKSNECESSTAGTYRQIPLPFRCRRPEIPLFAARPNRTYLVHLINIFDSEEAFFMG
jgi:hypothetical protein